jgi:hypothetical protein
MPAQLANESFRADHVRFDNSVGAIVQVLMRSDVPTAEAFFRDHLGSEALLYEAAILGVAYSLIRGTYREIRIEKIGKPNAVSLRRESQQAAVGIERIASSRFQKLEADAEHIFSAAKGDHSCARAHGGRLHEQAVEPSTSACDTHS